MRFPELAISQDQVLLVSEALLGNQSVASRRAEAADIYLRVWRAFSENYMTDPAFPRLQVNVVMIAAKMALYPPFQPGSRGVLRQISSIEPKWLPAFIRAFPGMVFTKIHSFLIRKNRK